MVKTLLFQLKGIRLSDGRGDGTEDTDMTGNLS